MFGAKRNQSKIEAEGIRVRTCFGYAGVFAKKFRQSEKESRKNFVLTNIICEMSQLRNHTAELSFSGRQFYTDMVAECSPETSVSTYNTTRCQNIQNTVKWGGESPYYENNLENCVFELTKTLLTFSKASLKSGMVEHYRYKSICSAVVPSVR